MPMLNWFQDTEMDRGESIGCFRDDLPFDYPPDCPKCGKPAQYWEGQIGEEQYTGRAIYASHYYCPDCHIKTMTEEV